jgi:hypothetical protein
MDERRTDMREAEVRERAFAMPLTSPAYPPGPYRFIDREYLMLSRSPAVTGCGSRFAAGARGQTQRSE